MNTARYFMNIWHHTIHCNKAVSTKELPTKGNSIPSTCTPCQCDQKTTSNELEIRRRFIVSQSTIAVGHFHFYSEDNTDINPIRGTPRKCLRFSSFGEGSDFSLCTENGINLAWVRHSNDYCDSKQCLSLDLNKSTWSYNRVLMESDCGNCLPIMHVHSKEDSISSYTWIRSHPLVSDGLALVNLNLPDVVIGVYTLPGRSVRTGTLDFINSKLDTMCDEDMNLFILFLASSLATVPKTNPKPSLSKSSSTSSDSYSTNSPTTPSPVPTRKNSDLLFQKTHVW